jgi:hypothetical protein
MMITKLVLVLSFFCALNLSHADTLNIFTHFDTDRNEILDENELEEVFSLLRPVMLEKYQLSQNTEKYAHSLFFYKILNGDSLKRGSIDLAKFVSFDQCFQSDFCKHKFIPKISVNKIEFDAFLSIIQ